MDVYEPYLLQLGFLDRTPRGRRATRRAYEHLGVEPPTQDTGPDATRPALFYQEGAPIRHSPRTREPCKTQIS